MPEYRIHELDHAGDIVRGRDFDCDCDDGALAEALVGLRSAERAEVWCGTRCLGQCVKHDRSG